MEKRKHKIAFFSKGDNKFLDDIAETLSERYDIKNIVISNNQKLSNMDKWMSWADICWFEWCDNLLAYASKLDLAREKIIVCRLHSYEAFTDYPAQVNWDNVDKLVFVSEGLQKYTVENFKINKEITAVIPNGINIQKWRFRQRHSGFNVAYVGYINYKKGPMLLLQTFKAIYDRDRRYKFYLAGQYQDPRYLLYFKQMIKELGLENNFYFDGWQKDIDKWLEDKDYILCSSVLESQNMSVMQAMAKGIKPVIHNFAGAKGIYPDRYLWNTIEAAVSMVTENRYDSQEYREFIQQNYSFASQIKEINCMLEALLKNKSKIDSFNYQAYWSKRLDNNFNIEGVGYMGLGEIYNKFLYRTRLDLLDNVINSLFKDIYNGRILELGPGTGIFTEFFKNKGARSYEGIDISEKSVKELSLRYPYYIFNHGDICENSSYRNDYDLILAADVLLCITGNVQYTQTVQNIAKHLSTDGIFISFDPVSTINKKSESPHMAIRDRGYVIKTFMQNGLELVGVLPVTYFMNYPFDSDIAGSNSNKAIELFNSICDLFTDKAISPEDKIDIGEYLLLRDRVLMHSWGAGLSEKLMIFKKSESSININIDSKAIYDMEVMDSRIRDISLKLQQKEILKTDKFLKINTLLCSLDTKEQTPFGYFQKPLDKFIPYFYRDFDLYDFNNAQIMLGRRDKTVSGYELIEFVLNSTQNSKLVLNNIWYNEMENRFILPEEMKKSQNINKIIELCKEVLTCDLNFYNRIGGFIFDPATKEDVRNNYTAYMWERGIPASEFLPLLTYLKIAERYLFASDFINEESYVLEAPCGFGYGAAYLSKICRHVEALDIADENIAFSKQAFNRKNINWRNGDVTRLPYDADTFDIYVSYEVFEHLPVDTALCHIKEGYRVLKKSGKLLISTPNRLMRKNIKNPFHIKEYDFSEFNSILKKVFKSVEFYSVRGFKVEKGMNEDAYVMIAVCEK
ncbi:MAG: glycosyltransferase [Eubacterium sp.]|nr:glycosyltransferase [Eubacterium sp.]